MSSEALQNKTGPFLGKFAHIYVEEGLSGDAEAERILSLFPDARVIPISHYKDVFNRRRQNIPLQHDTQNLILARRTGRAVFPGAPVCQSFGQEHFYYCSSVMNCVYSCSYCYLKGMYPSGNLVVFLNLDEIFAQVEELLQKIPVYLCVSYDTDLLPLEPILGAVQKWCAFTASHKDLTIEIRTKCGRTDLYSHLPKSDRVIFAFTLSPEEVAEKYEAGASALKERLLAANAAMAAGFPVRLCFDPMLHVPDWEGAYARLLETVRETIDLARVRDFSIGTFRISEQYLKNMQKSEPQSAVVQYPFIRKNGYCQYPEELAGRMEQFMKEKLLELCPGARIFFWEEEGR